MKPMKRIYLFSILVLSLMIFVSNAEISANDDKKVMTFNELTSSSELGEVSEKVDKGTMDDILKSVSDQKSKFTPKKKASKNGANQLPDGAKLPYGTPVKKTDKTSAKGFVTQNVGSDNKSFKRPNFGEEKNSKVYYGDKEDFAIKSDSEKKDEKKEKSGEKSSFLERRQFLKIVTRNGKEFYMIVNHDADGEEAQLLSEVSEQDLLNFIVDQPEPKPEPTTTPTTTEAPKEEKVEVKEESSNVGTYIFLVVLLVGFAAVVYYFKIYKKQHDLDGDFEEEAAEEEEEEPSDGNEAQK